jgi:hypothetical protein
MFVLYVCASYKILTAFLYVLSWNCLLSTRTFSATKIIVDPRISDLITMYPKPQAGMSKSRRSMSYILRERGREGGRDVYALRRISRSISISGPIADAQSPEVCAWCQLLLFTAGQARIPAPNKKEKREVGCDQSLNVGQWMKRVLIGFPDVNILSGPTLCSAW